VSQLSRAYQRLKPNFRLSRTQLGLVSAGFLLALAWWGFGLWLAENDAPIHVWGDQAWVFLNRPYDILNPYDTLGFVNMPWAKLFLLPLAPLPFSVGVLAQLVIYFVVLALVFDRFSRPNMTTFWKVIGLLSALLSPLALDTAVELNIDWIVAIGLLVPPAYSAPFLLVKPQNAIGYLASFDWRTLVRWILIALITLCLSFVIWGGWIVDWYTSWDFRPVAYLVNVAPSTIIGRIPAYVIGAILLFIAMRRKDAVAGVWGGMFFLPYIASYSVLIPYTLLASRFPRITLLLTVSLWIVVILIIG